MAEAAVGARTAVPIPFIDLQAQRRRIDDRLRRAIDAVLAHGQFIMGPEVGRLEQELAAYCGVKHAIGCSSGTDALVLALMALEVRPGDAVFVPSFTFAATAEAVVLVGATPVFVDCLESTFNMDVASLARAIQAIQQQKKLRPAGAITVDLFGQPADYDAIEPVLRQHGLWLVADAAQSFGSAYRGRRAGAIGKIATTSFFPAKPLGCYGDGGAIFTDDDALAAVMRSLLFHGKGDDKYDNVRIGMNGRLDTLQAAILLEKLRIFDDELKARDRIAARYTEKLGKVARVPAIVRGANSVWAQYTIMVERRDRVARELNAQGIPTAIYYPKPLHRQTAYKAYPCAPGGLPVSDKIAQYVLSLPMHPYLDEATQDRIVAAVVAALR
ncbi:MAG TPA: DegT/DnrJ/EryC1/StrS family aminotransferase [Xanthobacteraceae bacterium]|nr:DegT/DnrJ/EryC1/StrS family aminotransferase [Xanthobacteraceae bacterium]